MWYMQNKLILWKIISSLIMKKELNVQKTKINLELNSVNYITIHFSTFGKQIENPEKYKHTTIADNEKKSLKNSI